LAQRDRYLLILVSTITATQAFVSSVYRPLLPQYGLVIGLSPSEIGIIMSAFSLLPLFLSVPTGTLVDLWGPKPMLISGYLAMAANGVLLWRASTLSALVVTQVLAGLGQMFIIIAGQTYVSTLGGRRDRENNFGIFAFAMSAGRLVGPILGGSSADILGFSFTFLVSGLIALLPLVAVFWLREANPETAAERRNGHKFPTPAKLGNLLQRDGIQAAMVASFSVIFTMGVRGTFLPLYLAGLGFSATTVGLILSARALSSMMVRPFMSRVIQVVGRRRLLIGSMFAGAASVLLIPAFRWFWPLVMLSLIGGAGTGFTQPLTMVSVVDQTSNEDRGVALGLRMTGNRTANLTNPLAFGFVAEIAGLGVAFVSAGVLLIGSTLLMFRWRGVFVSERGYAA